MEDEQLFHCTKQCGSIELFNERSSIILCIDVVLINAE